MSLEERELADFLKNKLCEIGYEPYEDDARDKVNGSSGNIICKIEGDKNISSIVLMAHMDTVSPGLTKKAIIKNDVIMSDGTTILGSDDVAGIVCILEAVTILKSNSIIHGDIWVIFTVAEEIGLLGAKNLDYNTIKAEYGFVLDGGGDVGIVYVETPYHNTFKIIVEGKASHAAEPQNGINSIAIASEAITCIKQGKVDEESFINIGRISGGRATNIICDYIEIHGEVRSGSKNKLNNHIKNIEKCFREISQKYSSKTTISVEHFYDGYKIDENDKLVNILKLASKECEIELKLQACSGGGDANILNSAGIKAVDISVGMQNMHTVEERISIDDLIKATQFLVSIIKNV